MGGDVPQSIDGPFIMAIVKQAKALGISVAIGINEKCPIPDKYYNTIVFLNSQGSILASYRKTHLFDAFNVRESDSMLAGDQMTPPIITEFGIVGILTCYEIRFPELARILSLAGTQILLVPSAWFRGPMKEDHWLTILKARALENTVFVVAVDQTGNSYAGRSVVVDPFGVVIADAGIEEKLLITELDLETISRVRKILPVLEHRRQKIYQEHWL